VSHAGSGHTSVLRKRAGEYNHNASCVSPSPSVGAYIETWSLSPNACTQLAYSFRNTAATSKPALCSTYKKHRPALGHVIAHVVRSILLSLVRGRHSSHATN